MKCPQILATCFLDDIREIRDYLILFLKIQMKVRPSFKGMSSLFDKIPCFFVIAL
jgi:hypothetical protein